MHANGKWNLTPQTLRTHTHKWKGSPLTYSNQINKMSSRNRSNMPGGNIKHPAATSAFKSSRLNSDLLNGLKCAQKRPSVKGSSEIGSRRRVLQTKGLTELAGQIIEIAFHIACWIPNNIYSAQFKLCAVQMFAISWRPRGQKVANKSDLKIMPKTNNITCYTQAHTQGAIWSGGFRGEMRYAMPAALSVYLFNQHSTVGLVGASFFRLPLSQIKCGA